MQGFPSRRKPSKRIEEGDAVRTRRQHTIYIAATVAIMCIAFLFVLFGEHGSALQRCKGIILQPQRVSCLDALAGTEMNASICNLIGYAQSRDSCVSGIAESTSSIALCSQLSDSGARADCVLKISESERNISDCALVDAPYNSTCAYEIASEERFANVQDCASIQNETLRLTCTYLYDYGSALASDNASYCKPLTNVRNMSIMAEIFNMGGMNSSQLMSLSTINVTPQNYCYYSLAMRTHDRSLCSFMSGYMNAICSGALSNTTIPNNVTGKTMCNYASSSWLKFMCEYGVLTAQAVQERNASVCMQISGNTTVMQYQYACITAIAQKYKDVSYCNYISNATVNNDCTMSAEYANTTT